MTSHVSFGTCLALGAVGLLILGVQPLLYGLYVQSGVITEPQLGMLAAFEIASISIGSAAGVAITSRISPKPMAVLGVVFYAVGNLVPESVPIFTARTVAGFGGGLLVSLAALAIAQRKDLNRAAAIFLFLQAASQYAVLQWFSGVQLAETATEVQTVFVVLTLGALFLLFPMIPTKLAETGAEGETVTARPSKNGIVALAAASLFVGGSIAIWAYLGLWLEVSGSSSGRAASMLTACLAGQMAGALLAAILQSDGRLGRRILAMSTVVVLCAIGLLFGDAQGAFGWGLIVVYGIAWLIVLPAITGFLEEVDPTRGSVPFAAAAQLCGAALVPTVLGYSFAAQSLDLVFVTAIGVIGVSLLIVAALMFRAPVADTAISE